MKLTDEQTRELLEQAARGSQAATQQLFAGHRPRLRQMVGVRMDRRLSARIDPSDVVQEVLTEAVLRLSDYLAKRPLPFYPWLRKLAWDHLVTLHRRHIVAQKRSLIKERPNHEELGDDSVMMLVDRLVSPQASPSDLAVRHELQRQVREAIDALNETDRELLLMKYLEHLTLREIAAILKITETAAKARHVRALNRFSELIRFR